jgi:hypothetical protein
MVRFGQTTSIQEFCGRLRLLARYCAGLLLMAALGFSQDLIIPQIADGGGWQTTLALTNTTAAAAPVTLSFHRETSGGNTENWNPVFQESTSGLSLAAGRTTFLHTLGTATLTSVGWGEVRAGSGVAAYAIFTARGSGRADQEGTAQAVTAASRVLVPFDNTSGLVTSVALVNPTTASEPVTVAIRTARGAVFQPAMPVLPAQGHLAFGLPQQFPDTNGQQGLMEFYSPSGALSVIALRFNPSGAFTAAPVYGQTGPQVITGTSSGGSSGNSTLKTFTSGTVQFDYPGTWGITASGSAAALKPNNAQDPRQLIYLEWSSFGTQCAISDSWQKFYGVLVSQLILDANWFAPELVAEETAFPAGRAITYRHRNRDGQGEIYTTSMCRHGFVVNNLTSNYPRDAQILAVRGTIMNSLAFGGPPTLVGDPWQWKVDPTTQIRFTAETTATWETSIAQSPQTCNGTYQRSGNTIDFSWKCAAPPPPTGRCTLDLSYTQMTLTCTDRKYEFSASSK